METISLKMEDNLLKEIDTKLKLFRFATRTEFIRQAIRDKLEDLEREALLQEFMKFRGKAEKKTTYEDNRRTREIVGKELMEELEKRFR